MGTQPKVFYLFRPVKQAKPSLPRVFIKDEKIPLVYRPRISPPILPSSFQPDSICDFIPQYLRCLLRHTHVYSPCTARTVDVDKISSKTVTLCKYLAKLSGRDAEYPPYHVCLYHDWDFSEQFKDLLWEQVQRNEGLTEGKTLDSKVHKENALSIFSLLGLNPSVPFL